MTWPAAEFGDAWAAIYDDAHPDQAAEAAAAVALLCARVPADGRLLELGVGTGRLAIPLVMAGLRVVGLDASHRMVEVLGSKRGGDGVTLLVADMCNPPLAGPFDLVLCAFNTLFALPDAAAQVRCLTEAARLAPDGEVVIDAAVPQPSRLDPRGHDPVSQVFRTTHVIDGVGALPLNGRYAHPTQIDRMARAAGLAVHTRYADWAGAPFTDDADRHITVYRPTHTGSPSPGAAR